jgi:hypothetical protein
MLLRLLIALLWLACAGGWYMCIAAVIQIIGGSQWLEATGTSKYVTPLAFAIAMCVLSALLYLWMGRIPTVVLVAVGAPVTLALLSAANLSIFVDAFPMHTSFLGSPPGNAWRLLVPGGTLAVLLVSFLLGRPTGAEQPDA